MFAAMAGLETAMWDLVGKAVGQPVYNLVGGAVRNRLQVYANGWYAFGGDLGRLAAQAQSVVARGYRAMKFDPFGPGGRELTRDQLRQAVRVVEVVRNAVGDQIDVMLEFHGRFSPITALEAIRAMVPYRPRWCEEPIPAHNHESMAQVVAASPLRVATGEHTYSRFGFLDLLMRKGVHLIQPDIVYSGGFLETKKIASMAETFYVSVAPHNCRGPLGTVIAMHLCANIPNFDVLETFEDYDVTWRCDLTPGTPRVQRGYYAIPSGAGWGVEVDEDLIRAHPENPDAKLNMFSEQWEQNMCQ
jgi:galactonate dehydratase